MFRTANSIARQFTFPVVLSRKSVSGACSSTIGSFVVINDEGWIVTAGHIIDQLKKMIDDEATYGARQEAVDKIQGDMTLSPKDKSRAMRALEKPTPDTTEKASVWWARVGTELINIKRLQGVDLAIAQLKDFDPKCVGQFPTFKDPAKDFEPGTSLCKLGFPFHQITPSWDSDTCTFRLPEGAFPIPFFPMDGIFTRMIGATLVDQDGTPVPMPFPLLNVETSTPGLRGQSGGPIFDVHGSIWAIQCYTSHVPLGFEAKLAASDGRPIVGHQVINLGVGVSAHTVIGALQHFGIKHTVSTY